MRPKATKKALEEPYNIEKIHYETSSWYTAVIALTPFILLCGVYFIISAKNSANANKIAPLDEIAAAAVTRLIKSLKSSRNNQEFAFSTRDVGRLINSTAQHKSIIREATRQNLDRFIWKAVEEFANNCASAECDAKLKILLLLLRDYVRIGGNITVGIDGLNSALNHCTNNEELMNSVFATLSLIAKKTTLPEGIAEMCLNQEKKIGHGPWSDYVTDAIGSCDLSSPKDRELFEEYMNYELLEKERWSKKYVSTFCAAAEKNKFAGAEKICSEL